MRQGAARRASDIAAHRHHQSARDHGPLGPRHRHADPQRHRLAGPPHRRPLRSACARAGHEPEIAGKTGLLLDPYFSASKIAWLLDHVAGARDARRRAAELAFGTVDCFLLWRLTGGKVHATDATNASRTLLFDIQHGRLGRRLLPTVRRAARRCCREVRDCAGDFGVTRAGPVRRADPRSSAWPAISRRPRSARPASARHDEIDLRHRLLRAAQHRRRRGRLAQPAAHHHRLSARRASAPMRWKARSSSPAPRCNGCATGSSSSPRRRRPSALAARADPAEQVYLVPAFVGLGAPYWDAQARGAHLRAHPRYRHRARSRARRWKRSATRPATCSRPCAPIGRTASRAPCCGSTAA